MLIQELINEQPIVGPKGSLTTITYDPRTSPEWLIPHVLGPEGVVVAFDRPFNSSHRARTTASVPPIEVCDLSESLFDRQLKPINLTKLNERLQQYAGKPIALLAPDILVGSGQPAENILGFIQGLLTTNAVVAVVAVSDALTDDSLDIGVEQNRLLTRLLYGSRYALNLQPFKTGRADDITGVFSISIGPKANSSQPGSSGTAHRELLYTVSANHSVALSTR